jgi:hypothetical protein
VGSDFNCLEIDLTKWERVMDSFPSTVERHVLRQARQSLADVRNTARKIHRFRATSGRRPTGRYYKNTGRLERSVQVEMFDSGGRVYLDTGIADYGPYVHEGQRSWAPDQFIYESMFAWKEQIIADIGNAVAEAISEL